MTGDCSRKLMLLFVLITFDSILGEFLRFWTIVNSTVFTLSRPGRGGGNSARGDFGRK